MALKRQYHCMILHIYLVFLFVVTVNWQKIKKVSYKKLHSLGKDISIGTHDPDNVTFYYTSSQFIKCWRE